MGDAADDAWDDIFTAHTELTLMIRAIRQNCEKGGECKIVNTEQDIETADWMPYLCASCGQRFDFP